MKEEWLDTTRKIANDYLQKRLCTTGRMNLWAANGVKYWLPAGGQTNFHKAAREAQPLNAWIEQSQHQAIPLGGLNWSPCTLTWPSLHLWSRSAGYRFEPTERCRATQPCAHGCNYALHRRHDCRNGISTAPKSRMEQCRSRAESGLGFRWARQ